MAKFDMTKLNVAVDRLLEQTENPRDRYLLMAYGRDRYLEVAGRYSEIFALDMTVGRPVYHLNVNGNEIELKGEERVRSLCRMWADTHQSVFYVEDEQIAASDNHVVSVAGTVYQQVSGKSVRANKWLAFLPKAISRRLLEAVLDQKHHHSDPDDMYLYKVVGRQMIWPYDDRGRLIGEDVHEPRIAEPELIKLAAQDVLTTEASGRLLGPLIKPLPADDDVVRGKAAVVCAQQGHAIARLPVQSHRARHASASIVLACMAACGGGDGGGPFIPAPPPTAVTIVAPADLAANLDGILLAVAQTADVQTTRVEFQLDGIDAGVANAAPYSIGIDTTRHASGQHVLRARAVDALGQASNWAAVTLHFAGRRTQPAGFVRDEAFVAGLRQATAFATAADGRLFIAEQGGALRVVDAGGLLATPAVTLAVDAAGERGLLGVALHPQFASNGWIYLYHTTRDGGTHNRISRFTLSGDRVLPGSELRLVELPALSAATNHNGGALHFDIDGKLYVGVGDNARGANAQDLDTRLGKMLRYNDDGTIPTDNPFCSDAANPACAVWAYGLRNPFTFAVQPGGGRIFINDVGESRWEEIDVCVAGANYGWPASEGPDGAGAGVAAPLFAYGHALATPAGSGPGGFFVGFAITGGTFYPDTGSFGAPYRGGYFFADLAGRFVGFIDPANANAAYAFGAVSDAPVDMLVANDGALLVLTRSGVTRFGKL